MHLILPAIVGVAAVLCLVWSLLGGGWRWWPSSRGRLCPGPVLGWRARLCCLWIVYRPACGYDLSGHPPDAAGGRTCPECGRRVRRTGHMVRSEQALRPAGIACCLAALAALLYRFPPVAGTTVVAMASTDVLLRGEGLLGVGTPLEVREEVRRRAMDFQLDDAQIAAFVALLVHDLRDDHLVGNAKDALERLAIFGVFCDGPLIEALASDDAQQRRMAASILRELPRDGPVPEALLRATIDELRSDDVGWNGYAARWYLADHIGEAKLLLAEALDSADSQQRVAAKELLRQTSTDGEVFDKLLALSADDLRSEHGRNTASGGFGYLLDHADAAEPLLDAGMRGRDARQRFLCAAVAGCAGRSSLVDQAVPILVEHLAENGIANDAIIAARALVGFGPPVAERLDPWRSSSDQQQRQTVEYIVLRITTSESPIRLQMRLPLSRLTMRERDALTLDPSTLRMPEFE